MSRRNLAYVKPDGTPTLTPLDALEARSEAGNDVLSRLAEAGALKKAVRGTAIPAKKVTIELSPQEHAHLTAHARAAGLSAREVIRLCLAPVLRKP